jgi:hypothetical protein
MTKRATCTKAQVRRIISAARLEGLRVKGIRPDGTILVDERDEEKLEEIENEYEVVL